MATPLRHKIRLIPLANQHGPVLTYQALDDWQNGITQCCGRPISPINGHKQLPHNYLKTGLKMFILIPVNSERNGLSACDINNFHKTIWRLVYHCLSYSLSTLNGPVSAPLGSRYLAIALESISSDLVEVYSYCLLNWSKHMINHRLLWLRVRR